MIEAVIYDLDGLMVNSEPLHMQAWNIVLAPYGKKLSDIPTEAFRTFFGLRVLEVTSRIIGYLGLCTTTDELYNAKTVEFYRLVKDTLEMMPGLVGSLEIFRKNSIKLAIVSSNRGDYINMVVKKFGLAEYFDAIVCGEDVTKGKPDPEPYITACTRLGTVPRKCLVLEDAAAGIVSAKAAGCRCIAVINPYIPAQDMSMADRTIKSLKELDMNMIADF